MMQNDGVTQPTIFTIRPHRGGWQCVEGEGVAPYYIGDEARRMAIDYAKCRTSNREGEIRIFNAAGVLEETIPFDERSNRMRV